MKHQKPVLSRFTVIVGLGAAFLLSNANFVAHWLAYALADANPVSVTLDTPTNGSIVSNTITLTAHADSVARPIAKVEFYRDGTNLVGVAYPDPLAPGQFKVTILQP